MTSISFHPRRHNTQENVSYGLDFYDSADLHFSHFEELKSTFYTSLHFTPRVMYYSVSGVWKSVIVYRTEIKPKNTFSWVRTSNMPIGNTVFHIQTDVPEFIMNLSGIRVLLI